MAANDQTYEPDVDEDEDFLQTSNNFRRPVTADTGVETVNTTIIWRVLKPKTKPSNQNGRNEPNPRNDGNRGTMHQIHYSFSRCFVTRFGRSWFGILFGILVWYSEVLVFCFGGYSRFVSMF